MMCQLLEGIWSWNITIYLSRLEILGKRTHVANTVVDVEFEITEEEEMELDMMVQQKIDNIPLSNLSVPSDNDPMVSVFIYIIINI